MSLSINRWIDQYPFIANEESNITLGLTFFTTSLILFGTRNSNFWYPTPTDLKEIDLSKETKESLMSKLDKGSQLTPVKLRGATITASTMKENNFDVKRAFSAVPGKPIAASDPEGSSVPIPREIAKFYNEIDRSLYKTRELRQSKNDFYLTAGDSKSPTIMVKNDGGEYTNLRYLKTYDNDYYKKVLNDSPINQIIDKAQFNDVRMVLLEGEIITLGGYLHYNSKEDELQIAHIFSIASGCAEKLFDNAFKFYKRNRNMLKYLAGVSLCISVLFLTFSYQRSKSLG
ncbi:unnamed protein product [Moneuplotes crassus]|uniref:Uncharacterized protein n=1 Tax=Euplotes crassus TaxID=5936 RepID=A0AAD1XEB5_EUPCR|nr:unnamed protein product [Moneuplotes crassus]